jgi:hypothetical protein
VLARVAVLVCAFGFPSALRAQLGIGTWVRQGDDLKGGTMTMTVEACCHGGRKLTYHISMTNGTSSVMTVESPFDGTEVPVLVGGKPSGETMAIKFVDAHHTMTVVKMGGRPFGTSRATISADGKTLTVVNETPLSGGSKAGGKTTETWVRK